MKISGIYKIQSLSHPERIYIGSANDINKRWKEHLNILKNQNQGNKKLQNHFNKYGIADLQFSILLGCKKEDLLKTEQYFLDSYKPWFNILEIAGSPKGYKHSEEARLKISIALKGKNSHPMSEETKRKISKANKGCFVSEEEKQKRRHPHKCFKKRIGRKQSESTKIKIGMANKGTRRTDEQKKRMSLSHRSKKKII